MRVVIKLIPKKKLAWFSTWPENLCPVNVFYGCQLNTSLLLLSDLEDLNVVFSVQHAIIRLFDYRRLNTTNQSLWRQNPLT